MYYELALISVLVAGGYWGWYYVREPSTRTYGFMLLGAAALTGIELVCRKLDVHGFGPGGAIGVGVGVCELVVGPVVRGLARRLAAAERFALAARCLDVAEVLMPGAGVPDEKALLGAMREIREGNIEQTVGALTAARDRAPAEARLAIDERIAMLYLASYRWDEAIAHAEENLFGAMSPAEPAASSRPVALRRALGVAPPVWVELLGAYGYKGNLDKAAEMLARLEDVCEGREDAAMWVHRGRLIFLALAGRVGAVRTLVEPRRSRHMKRAARSYWIAVALERGGDGPAAEAAYTKARARSRGRPRVLIDQALARLADVRPAELGPTAQELVARVEAAPPPVVVDRAQPRGPWATWLVTASLLVVAAVVRLGLGPSTDVGVLMRGGAMVRGLVHAGEWWRLVSCVFIHVGGLHLLVNVTGMWFLGRLVEDLFGPWRVLAIFGVAGVVGSSASFLASPAGVSAGASGAIFGLLGAVFVELTWHRRRHRAAWNRGVWGSLAVVTVAQVGIGFLYPAIDQWAHGGGLAAGALLGGLLSPHARWERLGRQLARVVAIAFALATIASAVMVVQTTIAASLARSPQVTHSIGGVTAEAPATWQTGDGELFDPDLFVVLAVERAPAEGDLAAQLAAYAEQEPARAKARHFDEVKEAHQTVVGLPPGWQGSELVVSVADPLGGRQHYRVVVAGRPDGGDVLLASLYLPDTVAHADARFFTRLLASVQ